MNMRISTLALALALVACGEGEKGDPGEDGADGAAGADGADGAAGEDGAAGADGADAAETLIEVERTFEERYGCDQGYEVTRIGFDDGEGGGTAGDGVLQDGEVREEVLSCMGEDVDDDGTVNLDDNCPEDRNPGQRDADFDGEGDACDEPVTGVMMYGITKGSRSLSSKLYSYDTGTGEATLIGDTGHALISLQINPADGLLYATVRGWTDGEPGDMDVGECDGCLVTLDTTSAAVTVVSTLDLAPFPSIAFLQDGTMYGWTEDGDELRLIDPTTGETTGPLIEMGSSGHSMGATSSDRLLWMEDADLYDLDYTAEDYDYLGYAWDDWDGDWDDLPDRLRGDVSQDGQWWIGADSSQGGTIGVADLSGMDSVGPIGLGYWPAPDGVNFHQMTFAD